MDDNSGRNVLEGRLDVPVGRSHWNLKWGVEVEVEERREKRWEVDG